MPRTPNLSRALRTLAVVAGLAVAGQAAALIPGAANGLPCGGTVLVEDGDTLADIATYCGVDAAAIVAANPTLTNPDAIVAGQSLTIPGAVPAPPAAAEDLEDLLAPVALYPDALLAEVLTAATYPLELVQAHRWVQENGSEADPTGQDWAPSVQALVRYPDVLAMMSNDLDWSIRLGDAFLADPDGVFDSIQVLRGRAQAAGNLRDNDKQQIIVEPVRSLDQSETVVEVVEPVVEQRTIIRIVPRYETLFVPTYHPRWVYYPRHFYSSFFFDPVITFGVGYPVGGWLTHYVDWHYGFVRLTPYYYRHPRFFYGHNVRFGYNPYRWTPWVHHPFHRRGYRYVDVPRVRVNQGQRHLVNVVPRSSAVGRSAVGRSAVGRSGAVPRATRTDYRQAERAAALSRSRGGARYVAEPRSPQAAGSRAITSRLANGRTRTATGTTRGTTSAARAADANQARAFGDARTQLARRLDENPASRQQNASTRSFAGRTSQSATTTGRSARTSGTVVREPRAAASSRGSSTSAARTRLIERMDSAPPSRSASGTVIRQRGTNGTQRASSGTVVRERSTAAQQRYSNPRYAAPSARAPAPARSQNRTVVRQPSTNYSPGAAQRSTGPTRSVAPSRSMAPRAPTTRRAAPAQSRAAPRYSGGARSSQSRSSRSTGGARQRRR